MFCRDPRARASKENREKVFLGEVVFFRQQKNQKKRKEKKSNLFSLSLLSSPLFYESESTQTIRMIELVRIGRSV